MAIGKLTTFDALKAIARGPALDKGFVGSDRRTDGEWRLGAGGKGGDRGKSELHG